eukprot:366464-Chlamydomonas_euryale.AAC.4
MSTVAGVGALSSRLHLSRQPRKQIRKGKNNKFPGCENIKVWISKRKSNTAKTPPSCLQTRKILCLMPCARLYVVMRTGGKPVDTTPVHALVIAAIERHAPRMLTA